MTNMAPLAGIRRALRAGVTCAVAICSSAAALGAVSRVSASPLVIPSSLPLSETDADTLRHRIGAERLEGLRYFLAGHGVYADAGNRPGAATLVFYLPPFFFADPAARKVGEQVIDVDALELLDAFDALLSALSISPILLMRLESMASEYGEWLERMRDVLMERGWAATLGAADTQGWTANHWADQARALQASMTSRVEQLPVPDRQRLVAALTPIGNQLGLAPPSGPTLAASATTTLDWLAKIRAALASRTYGVRRATFISGWSKAEAALLSAYLDVRRDVRVKPLPVSQISVRAVSQTSAGAGLLDERVMGPELIRGVNLATSGICGQKSSCNVVIEYTELGARTALLSVFGATLMPIVFSGQALSTLESLPIVLDPPFEQMGQLASILARDGELGELLLEPVQRSPGTADRRSMTLRLNGMLLGAELPMDALAAESAASVGDACAAASGPSPPLEAARTASVVKRNQRWKQKPSRLFFDGFPLVCFEEQGSGLRKTILRACPDEPLEVGTQVGRGEEVARALCEGEPFASCLEASETLAGRFGPNLAGIRPTGLREEE